MLDNTGYKLTKDKKLTLGYFGGEPKTIRSWDHYCKNFNRAGAAFFARNLPYGTHTVTVTVAETKAEESEGTAIRIGAVLVS